MGTAKLKALPADVYDRLEESANRHGGIGYGVTIDRGVFPYAPCCVLGHAANVDTGNPNHHVNPFEVYTPTVQALVENVTEGDRNSAWLEVGDLNDRAVSAINLRKGLSHNTRVPFEDYCAELNIIRGN